MKWAMQTIHDFMKPLGFGQITGIDARRFAESGVEAQDLQAPRAAEMAAGRNRFPRNWAEYNNFTMLQIAHALATLVNGGTRIEPRLALRLQDPLTQAQNSGASSACQSGVSSEKCRTGQERHGGLTQEGTGRGVFAGAAYLSGGKTGTAQTITVSQEPAVQRKALAGNHKRDHSSLHRLCTSGKPPLSPWP